MKIAVIGQGYVGKAYSNWFESCGHRVIRYSLEEEHVGNGSAVRDASVVVIAVPTPTNSLGQDLSAIEDALKVAGGDRTVVIKSTVLPGTTDMLAQRRKGQTYFSPEFLRADHAAQDVQRPERTVIGVPEGGDDDVRWLVGLFPKGKKTFLTTAKTAEFIKYAANITLISKVAVANALYDVMPEGTEWATVERALTSDPRIGPSHFSPVVNGKRGAGGHCFVKDMRAFTESMGSDRYSLLYDIEEYNLHLLRSTDKDTDLVLEVLGLKGRSGKVN